MKAQSLSTSDNLNIVLSKDQNGNDLFTIDATENFTSQTFDVDGYCDIIIKANGLNEPVTITYEKSIDLLNWVGEWNENSTALFSETLDNDDVLNLNDKRGGKGWRRLKFAKGSNTAGPFNIWVMRYGN